MTTNALERLREKKRSGQPLTPLESVVWDAFWTQDPDAFDAAEELAQMEKEIKILREPWDALHEFVQSREHIHAPGRDVDKIIMDYAEQLEERLAALQAEAKP